MGLATAPILKSNSVIINGGAFCNRSDSKSSMSQGFHHQGIYSFSEGTSQEVQDHDQQQQHHIAQQSRRDKLRVQAGFDLPRGHHQLIPIDHQDEVVGSGIYETATGSGNMLSEMFNFNAAMMPGVGPSASELLASQIQAGMYRLPPSRVPPIGFEPLGDNWYNSNNNNSSGGGQGSTMVLGGSTSSTSHLGGSIVDHPEPQLNAHDSAVAMQLFRMNPAAQTHDPRSPSPPPPPPPQVALFGHQHQGLSLSLSSSLQPSDQDQLRLRDGVLYFNNNNTNSASDIQGQGQQSQGQPGGGGMGYGVVNVLRNSKYSRAAQELLEEFCSVGRGQFKGSRSSRNQYRSSASNPNPNPNAAASASANAAAGSSSSSKNAVASLSPADRFEHQRKKSKLLSMLDEVDRRYNHYCDQMQMVVNSFNSVMGFGAATPYTALAQKAMSRHFQCLKDAIVMQLKRTCELLGEKEVETSLGITKGETPRLRLLDQSLRQQRAFHQMGMMEQEAWRPQRGLPEHSVTILRAWLFEHFLHPYPSDADKHLLARQTGLSKNQVSNWFINARVRLWKPMIEEMYQQEAKEQAEAGNGRDDDANNQQTSQSPTNQIQTQMQNQQRPETKAPLERFPTSTSGAVAAPGADDVTNIPILPMMVDTPELCVPHDALYREYEATGLGPAARMRLGTTGDVSLTLGLRHAGNNNAPEKNRPFTIRDFGG